MNPFSSQQMFWVVVPELGSVAEQLAVHFQNQGFQVQIHPVSGQSVYVYLFRLNTGQAYQAQPRPDLMIYIETRQNHTVVQAGAATGSVGLKVWKALSNHGLDRHAMEVTGRCLYRVAGQPYPEAPAPVAAPMPGPMPPIPTPMAPTPPVSAPPYAGPHMEPVTPVTPMSPAAPASRLTRFCTRCGAEIFGEAKFCGQCGAAAPPHQ